MLPREKYLKRPLGERFIKLDKVDAERAAELHEKLITFDFHSHLFLDPDPPFPRIKNSGVTGFVEAVAVIDEVFDESMELLGQLLSLVNHQPYFVPAFCAEDIRRAKEEQKQAIMFQLEPQTWGLSLSRIDSSYGLGIRAAMLTFNSRNYIGDGCGERTDSGLSYFGLDVVERMNNVGMIIDLSHVGTKTTLDAIEASKDPVTCNHVGARALYPRCKRLKTDEELQALAEKGGLAGVSAVPNQLSGAEEQGIQDLLNHVDHIIDLIGVDHVGVGLDNIFGDQVESHRRAAETFKLERVGQKLRAPYMEGIENPEEWPNIIRGLVSRGYTDQEIEKIVGGNALKLIEKVIG
jgi:membrane dipeptidase